MNSVVFNYNYKNKREQTFGLFSDLHIDIDHFNEQLFHKHMKEICDKDGRIFTNGDNGNFITKNDRKRYTRSRDKFENDAQLDQAVDYLFSQLKPYVDHIDYLGLGNHEITSIKYNSTNPVDRIRDKLNAIRSRTLQPIVMGGYQGFIILRFHQNNQKIRRYIIYRHHGLGGNSPVTKGMIDFARVAPFYNADLFWLAHKHNQIIDDSMVRTFVNTKNDIVNTKLVFVMGSGYQIGKDIQTVGELKYEDDMNIKNTYNINYGEENFYHNVTNGFIELNLKIAGHHEQLLPTIISRRN